MKHFQLIVVMLAASALPALGQDSIAPTTFTATIPVGLSTQVNKTVTVGKVSKPVDVMFLEDATGSMGPAIAAIDGSFAANVTTIDGFASDVQFAVGNYLDKFQCPADPYAYQLNQNITNNNAAVQAALTGLNAIPPNGYGCDAPESNLYGLQQAASTTAWRAGSTRILIWVGDNTGHDPAGGVTEASAIAALQAQGVTVIAASATSGPGLDAVCSSAPCGTPNNNQASRITAATGGQDLGSFSAGTINAAIQAAILNAIAKYSTVSLGVSPVPAGVAITISPASIVGAFDRTTTRTFTFNVNFTGTLPGNYLFGINALVDGASVATENDNITVTAQPPAISKSFNPTKILPGGTSTLTLQISNPNAAVMAGVGVTDPLPPGVTVANPSGLTNTCGGAVTATPGSGTITLANGAIGALNSCTITVTVTSNEGIKVNTTGLVTSALFGTGNSATATLSVATPPVLSKVFGAVSMGPQNSTTLSFTLKNPNTVVPLTGLTFTDTLPTGLVVATPSVIAGVCDAGTITAVAGSNSISLGNPGVGATLGPGVSCTFTVNVTANGAALGLLTNTTSTVTSNEALPGAAASATIFIGDPFQITYAANLAVGDSFVDITNTGASGASLQSGTTASITGAICANVYAFTPDEQMVSCCSCPVTPNGLESLSAKLDLTNNTLTPAVPSALVVKMLATLPVANSCSNSAAGVATEPLANGMKAYGTTIHATPASTYGVTERPFSAATLSAGELNRLGSLCNFIIANGSGFGICNSCRLGGLGAERQ